MTLSLKKLNRGGDSCSLSSGYIKFRGTKEVVS